MRVHDPARRDFASDGAAGVHPDVLAAIVEANEGHQPGYGEDVYTAKLGELVRRHFGQQAQVSCVFNGTGANIVALQAMTPRGGAVICAASAHLNTDECAAPEHHGFKLLTLPETNGQIDAGSIGQVVTAARNRHHAQPGVVSISQTTELGAAYTPAQLRAITETAHHHGLPVHLDGARLANAAAALHLPLRALTTDVGIDVVSFGATKNGGMYGDCVIVLDPSRVHDLPLLQKATTQLPSKTRFIAAQLIALLTDELWLCNAATANATAQRLARGLADLGVPLAHPVEANAVFAQLPPQPSHSLRQQWTFSTWDAHRGVVRLMTAFDTLDADIEALLSHARRSLEEHQHVAV